MISGRHSRRRDLLYTILRSLSIPFFDFFADFFEVARFATQIGAYSAKWRSLRGRAAAFPDIAQRRRACALCHFCGMALPMYTDGTQQYCPSIGKSCFTARQLCALSAHPRDSRSCAARAWRSQLCAHMPLPGLDAHAFPRWACYRNAHICARRLHKAAFVICAYHRGMRRHGMYAAL